jgi:hypothetical protein
MACTLQNAIKIHPTMSICNQYGVICKDKITEQYGTHFTESIMVCTGQRQMGGFCELNTVRFSNFFFKYITTILIFCYNKCQSVTHTILLHRDFTVFENPCQRGLS